MHDKVIIVMQQLLVMHRDCLIRNIALSNIQSSSLSENYPGDTKEGAITHIIINENEQTGDNTNSGDLEYEIFQSSKFYPYLHVHHWYSFKTLNMEKGQSGGCLGGESAHVYRKLFIIEIQSDDFEI